jgi:hypothetical protein
MDALKRSPDIVDLEDETDAPPRFNEALDALRQTIIRCEQDGISEDTILAAAMTDMVSRLVNAYGEEAVAATLHSLAEEVTSWRTFPDRLTH